MFPPQGYGTNVWYYEKKMVKFITKFLNFRWNKCHCSLYCIYLSKKQKQTNKKKNKETQNKQTNKQKTHLLLRKKSQ